MEKVTLLGFTALEARGIYQLFVINNFTSRD